ncbi:MAG: PAS domain-containing sensor histidine kinase [Proteobacteria bacterium]|nr:PAS domain-containing sensor histidine kinase [Pseudomonadota bacterium]
MAENTDAMRAADTRRLLDFMPVAAFSVDGEGRIVVVNRLARMDLGYGIDEMEGRPLAEFVELEETAVAAIVKLWRGTNGPLPASLRMRSRSGKAILYQASGGNIAANGERPNLIVRCVHRQEAIVKFTELNNKIAVLAQELNNRRVLETALRNAKEAAENANRTKSQFLATMSHELRTPLNAIIGFSDLIKTEALGPVGTIQYREYSKDINEAGHHLLRLINDILDLSKIEAGKEELYEENLDIRAVINSALSLVRQRAEKNNIGLEIGIEEGTLELRADERKLTQILVNLLTNAIKYTKPGGTVTISAWCRRDSGFVLQVADTGIGIAPKDIPKALAQFGQVEGDLNRKHDGTGLGLPLTKALVELHGGSLDLQSKVGTGTTVTVRFPGLANCPAESNCSVIIVRANRLEKHVPC